MLVRNTTTEYATGNLAILTLALNTKGESGQRTFAQGSFVGGTPALPGRPINPWQSDTHTEPAIPEAGTA